MHPADAPPPPRGPIGRVLASPGAVRLVILRFASQFGDGMFQAALGGAILFDPQRGADPLAVAAGFAVLLLPYSLVGPFAGALLDRWDRRRVLMVASVLRGVLIVCATAQLASGSSNAAVLVTALAAVGVSRFVLAGLSASLPHVVRESWLVPTNSVLVTVGAGVSAAGAAVAVTVLGVLGPSDSSTAIATATAVVGSVVGAVAAAGFAPGRLGPGADVETAAPRTVIADVVRGLATGAHAVWTTPPVRSALTGVGAHRIAFGIDTLVMVLILRRNTESVLPGGVAGFGLTIGAAAAGMFVAAVTTPIVLPRFGRARTVAGALILAAAAQFGLVATLTPDLLVLGAFVLGAAGQTVKLTADAAMQMLIDDDRRGRVFALQDTVFNVAFVGAVAAAAMVIGARSTTVSSDAALACVVAGGVVYLLAALAVVRARR